jgi:long-chain acyl-CoA synthetase
MKGGVCMNIAAYIKKAVREYSHHIAIRMNNSEMTYFQFDRKASSLATYLQTNGFKKGDKVGIFLPNCPDYLVLMYATWMIGGVVVPINYRFRTEELKFVWEDSEIKWLAICSEDASQLKDILLSIPEIRLLTRGNHESLTSLETIYQMDGTKMDVVPCLDSEDAMIMYTSGTTGKPKGVMQTHRNNSASIEMVIDAWQLTSRDHLLGTFPMFHVGGLQCTTLPTLFTGGTITLLSKWKASDWIDLTHILKPTWSGMISTMLVDVVNYLKANVVEESLFDSYRFCFFGGSPTPNVICDYFEKKIKVNLFEIYGQTEMTGLMITYRLGEQRVPGSMGKPMSQVVNAKVVAPDSEKIVKPGDEEAGVLYLNGDVVTPGYWKREDLNRERIIDGWMKTGDIVRWNAEGYLYYTDRFDDMIVTGGENVYPKEVENVLAEHPGVAEVAVIGTPHERWIEQVTAIIVPYDSSITIEEIDLFCKQHQGLAGYKRPRRIEFIQELPKTGSGKISKNLLKQKYSKELPKIQNHS